MITQTKTDRFRDFIQREVLIAEEKGLMKKTELYKYLKSRIPGWGIPEESAMNIMKFETGIYFLES